MNSAMKRSLLLLISALTLLACTLPARVSARFSTTATSIPASSPSATASKTRWPTITYTPSITLTPVLPTPTATPTPIPPTATRTVTPVPPSLTPGVDEITSGADAWRLLSVSIVETIYAWSVDVTPYIFNSSPWSYRFLRMDFECLTGRSLISLYNSVKDDGLTLVYRRQGYPDIYLTDRQGRKHPVGILSRFWLAATIPADSRGFTLHFTHLPPFKPLNQP